MCEVEGACEGDSRYLKEEIEDAAIDQAFSDVTDDVGSLCIEDLAGDWKDAVGRFWNVIQECAIENVTGH